MNITAFVDCEVYSTKKASKEKGCSNWKERKRNDRERSQ